jgi:hypothetical protein
MKSDSAFSNSTFVIPHHITFVLINTHILGVY